ncbi:MAG: hypothetical protein MZW92_72595 [Comamonadaceae bacterium]|nr:hypothetical protein [Comamonadaceae bacterium]
MAEEKEFESYFQEYIDDGFRGVSADRPEIPNIENTLSGPPRCGIT